MGKQTGAALLMMTLILMIASGLLFIFGTNYILLQEKTADNQQDMNKSRAAAEAGLDYAMAFLLTNVNTIKGSASGGFINYTIASNSQSDNSTYSIVITNPVVNDYSRLQITATGRSPDGSSVRVVTQQVYAAGSAVQYGVMTQDAVNMGGNSSITGTFGVDAGGAVTQSGSASVSSVIQNDTSLSSLSDAQFFNKFFGTTPASAKGNSAYYLTQLGVPWSNMSGSVWIDSSVLLTGNITIGTPANPVVLVVNGTFVGQGNITVNGLIYTMNGASLSGNITVNGGVVSQGDINMTGSSVVNYDADILGKLTSLTGSSGYAKLPGSWRDF